MSLLSPTLEAFWAVAQKGTVQEASSILGLTQTGVTQRVKTLEKQLKVSLFKRSRTGMKLTAEGESLLHFVKISLINEGMALSKIQKAAFDYIIELNISGPPSFLRSRVIPNFLLIQSKHPQLKFKLSSETSKEAVASLKKGNCDLAFIKMTDLGREFDFKNIKAEKFKIVVPAKWKNLSLQEVLNKKNYLSTLEKESYLEFYLQKNKIKAVRTKPFIVTNELSLLFDFVEKEQGFCLASEDELQTELKNKKIVVLNQNCFFEVKWVLAWYPRAELGSDLKALINSIQ